jgi:hypothetical protein
MIHLFWDMRVVNSGGSDIKFFSLLSALEKCRVLINGVEVQHFNSNQICRYATKRGWLESHRDEVERDNAFYSECGQGQFLTSPGNLIDAVTIPAGGSVQFHTDVAHLIPYLHNLPMTAIGLLEIEFTLSQVATEVCDGTLSDLSLQDIRVWSNHKHFAMLPPAPFASHTIHYQDVEVYRLPASSTPFTAGTGQSYDFQANLLFPLRNHISRLAVYAIDPVGDPTGAFVSDVTDWVEKFDVLRNGVSFTENMLDTKQKVFSHVRRHLKSEGTYPPTNPGKTAHGAAFVLQYVWMSPVVEHKNDQLSDVKSSVPSEVSNRDNLVLRITNSATLSSTAELVYVLEYDAYWRISPNGGVVKVEA